jgi:hypothetical protein
MPAGPEAGRRSNLVRTGVRRSAYQGFGSARFIKPLEAHVEILKVRQIFTSSAKVA